MAKFRKEDLDPEVFRLFDRYVHSQLERRDFIERLGAFAVGGLTVKGILDYLQPKYHTAVQVPAGDPRLQEEYITYPSPRGGGEVQALKVKPANPLKPGPAGCVLVVHENRGLNPHIEDVARRAALAGFLVLAPDALSPLGGYPGNDDDGRELQRQRDRDEMLEDFIAGYDYLRNQADGNGKVGVVGFCFGGAIANLMAVRLPELAAAVPFYGGQPTLEEVPKISAPLMLQYAALDERVNAGWPAYAAALLEHGKQHSAHVYAEVQHGFHNDTTPRYDEMAAKLAWNRTVDFFNYYLS
ncbi:carboxymethylenebutenolidase [Lewinella marina]|uniref:Dienelactone hydrolase n=1 Tax=Neolewinella marina TaxID=438751 RepID=A0A2G0CHN4_9BACT|nr:dienelactone hydrolase family protein [Neolewinella marina]NJB85394.1 carboxymethylenebutenolidase [Neolewinella marina]PHK99493.1 dienelactone hydrolase [Neolewinella marina]